MAHTDFFDDDDEFVAPPTAPPAAVPEPHDEPRPPPPTATPTAATPKSLADILASAPAFLASELRAVVGALARGDPHINVADAETDVEQSDEEGPTGTHSSAPPAPAASSSTGAPAGAGLGALADTGAETDEERNWRRFMEDLPSDEEDSEPEAEPRYTGRDAEFLPVAQRFNTTVWPRIERELAGTSAIRYRRCALGEARRLLRIPGRSLDISRGDHGRGYGDPENVVCLEPAGRNRSRRSAPMTVGTQDELFSSPGVAGDIPLELTTEEEEAAVEAVRLAQTKAAANTPKRSRNLETCRAISGDVERHHCHQPEQAGEVLAGNCECKGEHIAAMIKFAMCGEPGAALDFVGMRQKTRHALYKQAGRLSRDLLQGRSLKLIAEKSDFLGRGEGEKTLRAVLVQLPPSPEPIVQCKGHVATGERCKITSRGDFPVGRPLREGGDFCAYHRQQAPPATPPAQRVASQLPPSSVPIMQCKGRAAATGERCRITSRGDFPVGRPLREGGCFCAYHRQQAPPATPPAQRVASRPTPEIATHFVSRKRGLDVAGPPHQGKRSLFTF